MMPSERHEAHQTHTVQNIKILTDCDQEGLEKQVNDLIINNAEADIPINVYHMQFATCSDRYSYTGVRYSVMIVYSKTVEVRDDAVRHRGTTL